MFTPQSQQVVFLGVQRPGEVTTTIVEDRRRNRAAPDHRHVREERGIRSSSLEHADTCTLSITTQQ